MSLDEKIQEAKREAEDSLLPMMRLAVELNRSGKSALLSALVDAFGLEKLIGPDIPKADHQALDLAKVIEFVREKLGAKPEAYERAFAGLARKHGLGIMGIDWASGPDHTAVSLFQRPGEPLSANDLDVALATMRSSTYGEHFLPPRPSLFMSADMANQFRQTIEDRDARQPFSSVPDSSLSGSASRAAAWMRGIQIVTSEACPENTVYLINPGAVNARSREELSRLVARVDGILEDR